MSRLTRLVSAACAAILIAACGGGGGGGGVVIDAVDKYIGSWADCLVVGTLSSQAVLAFAKRDANSAFYTLTATLHGDTTCTSPLPGSTVALDSGVVVVDFAMVAVAFTTVDKVTFNSAPSGISVKDIAFVNGNQLLGGDPLSPKDAGGYPTALDTGPPFIRQ
ncbi:MAG: hypothetical protein ACRECD_15810 [Burkholderiaceae bacterium]